MKRAHEAAAYDTWFRAQVQEAIDDPRPSIPHAQVMADAQAAIDAKRVAEVSSLMIDGKASGTTPNYLVS